ncbi:MAG: Smr/MutS family protein [Shimia sp.]
MPERIAPAPPPASSARIEPFTIGSKPSATAPAPAQKPAPRMDAKAFGRMTKGKLRPEGRIDLHGMYLDEAKPALESFLLTSHARGRRLVLVITGKGEGKGGPTGPLPYQRGILRRQVPAWLSQPPLVGIVLEVAPAARGHGGDGALYVYLRRSRR